MDLYTDETMKQKEKHSKGTLILRETMAYKNMTCTYNEQELIALIKKYYAHYINDKE